MKKQLLCTFLTVATLTTQAQKWSLVWSEEFDYTGLPNASKWIYDTGGDGFGNHELQYYTSNRTENARVENGELVIEARKEKYLTNAYTSARIKTQGFGDWTYGKFEVKAKLPSGRGIWPAIWMLPSEYKYGGWPSSGEIDIMEHVGYLPTSVHFTVHTEAYNHTKGTQKGEEVVMAASPSLDYHVYAVEWTTDTVNFLLDNVSVFTFLRTDNDYKKWPFDQNFHLLLNVAVGGDWGGAKGVDDAIFPQKMSVDYVRVYKKQDVTKNSFLLSTSASNGGSVVVNPLKNAYGRNEEAVITATPSAGYEFLAWKGTYASNAPTLPVKFQFDVAQRALFQKKGELVKNGYFESGAFWDATIPAANATRTIDSNKLNINIAKSATNPWDIQVSQKNLPLLEGHTYTFTFEAKSSQTTAFNAALGLSYDPWSSYISNSVQVGTTWKVYTFEYTMDKPTDLTTRVYFDVGKALGKVEIRNVSLVDETALGIAEEATTFSLALVQPNPVSAGDQLVVRSKQVNTFKISTLNGTLVPVVVQNLSDNSYQLQLPTDMKSGLYFLQIQGVHQSEVKKIMVR